MKFLEAKNGFEFWSIVVVRESKLCRTGQGKPYLDVILFDGETECRGKSWNHEGDIPVKGDILFILCTKEEYKGNPQVIITHWRPAKDHEIASVEFIPRCSGNLEEMFAEIKRLNNCITIPELKNMVFAILADYEKEFIIWPAAMTHHGAYIGGLLEHTYKVLVSAMSMSNSNGDYIDLNLILAGATLHDIGKLKSLKIGQLDIDMTNEGRFLDHIILGILLIKDYAVKYNVPSLVQEKLLHVLASHHGHYEWGSPVKPVLKEAMIIHHADLLDAQCNKMDNAIKTGKENQTEWAFVKGFGNVYTG